MSRPIVGFLAVLLMTTGAPAALRAADGPEKAAAADVQKIQGTWAVTALELSGVAMEPPVFRGAKIVVAGETFTTGMGGASSKGTFKINAAATPKTIDLSFTDGLEKGK